MATTKDNQTPVTGKSADGKSMVASTESAPGKADSAKKEYKRKVSEAYTNGQPFLLKQEEPLFTVRPRSELLPVGQKSKDGRITGGVLRGQRSAFRIIPGGGTRKSAETDTGHPTLDQLRKKLTTKDGDGFQDFLLTGIQLGFNEKVQVVQTFGDNDVFYYFGRTPTQVNISGMIFDDADNSWFTGFINVYNNYLRGTQLARNFELIQLVTPSCSIIGTINSLNYQQDAARDTDIPFSLSILVKQYWTIDAATTAKTMANLEDLQQLDWVFEDYTGSFVSSTSGRLNTYLNPSPEALAATPPGGWMDKWADTAKIFDDPEKGGWKQKITEGVKGINQKILAFTEGINTTIDKFLSPVTAFTDMVGEATGAVTSVLGTVKAATDSVVNNVGSVYSDLAVAEAQLKNAIGTITAFPETMSESLSRFLKGSDHGVPKFAGSRSVPSPQAVLLLASTNEPGPTRTPRVGPPTSTAQSGTSDERAELSF